MTAVRKAHPGPYSPKIIQYNTPGSFRISSSCLHADRFRPIRSPTRDWRDCLDEEEKEREQREAGKEVKAVVIVYK